MSRRISLPVRDERALDEIACTKRPFGMYPGRVTHKLLRETWFDTSDEALRERRLTLRLRLDAGGRSTVRLTRVTGVSLEGVVEEEVLESPVVGGGLYATLAGAGELATLVRGVVEPAALRPRIALDIDREVRELRPSLLARPILRVTCDRIVAHTAGASRGLFALDLSAVRRGTPSLEALVEHARHEYGLVHDGMDMLERVRTALRSGDEARGTAVPREVRVTLIIVRGGEVALVPTPDGLGPPSTRGSGEDIAREYLADVMGQPVPEGDLDLVGFSPTWRGGVDLELWLHQAVPAREGAQASGSVTSWVPLQELLERVGSEGLRGADLVAALHLLVLSEIGHRLLREAGGTPRASLDLLLPARPSDVDPGEDPSDFLDAELSILDFNRQGARAGRGRLGPAPGALSVPGDLLQQPRRVLHRAGRPPQDRSGPRGRGTERGAEVGGAPGRPRGPHPRAHGQAAAMSRRRALAGARHPRSPRAQLGGPRARPPGSLTRTFSEEIFPALTPAALSASPGHPFPRLASLGLSLVAVLRPRRTAAIHSSPTFPSPRTCRASSAFRVPRDVVPLEDLVAANAARSSPPSRSRACTCSG